jgi:hypothetical protein
MEGYMPPQSLGQHNMGRFYGNVDPSSHSRAIDSSSADSGPPFGQEKYFMGGGEEYGRLPHASSNGHAIQQQQAHAAIQPTLRNNTSPTYGGYPLPQAQQQLLPTHPYSHGAVPNLREGQLESMIEASPAPSREKKEKGASLNSSGTRPAPKPQSPLILQWYCLLSLDPTQSTHSLP